MTLSAASSKLLYLFIEEFSKLSSQAVGNLTLRD